MIRGLVQGVGFRPFICRLAAEHNLSGEVDNRSDGVSVIIQSDLKSADRFRRAILANAPPASQIKAIEIASKQIRDYSKFSIADSKNIDDQITEVSPDIAVCNDCLNDIVNDPYRINYPFVNCTNCGPRFSIIEELPYDRPKTTMRSFGMCSHCESEYNDILNRRFHAQPVACNYCGPVYTYRDYSISFSDINLITINISYQIAEGNTVAIKGLGGYHLVCDALNNDAVLRLRKRKQRDAKPFAVMFRNIDAVKDYCLLNDTEEREIISWRRPVLILKQKKTLSFSVSNGLDTTGALLPYMPVHYMIFNKLQTPALVFTSGNISEDPVIIDDKKAESEFQNIANAFLSYNREILNRVDDSVVRIINSKPSVIRRSRGYVPRPLDLTVDVEGIIALGAEQKNTFCIGKGHQAIMSQHIGDLKNKATYEFMRESVGRFSKLFRFRPSFIACDLHPDYLSSGYAESLEYEFDIPLIRIQHHHAHIASCMAEHGIADKVIGICFDGTGYGTDNNIWGGEFLIADMNSFNRYTHLDYIRLPGGDKAIEEPWRTGLSLIHRYHGREFDVRAVPGFRQIDDEKIRIVMEMLEKDINSPLTCGAGRFFDAVSAILGLCPSASYDSEAPMLLEAVCDFKTDEFYQFQTDDTVSLEETLNGIMKDLSQETVLVIAAKFHNTIAHIILEVSEKIRRDSMLDRVVLSGGVFQNKYLTEKAVSLLASKGFNVYLNHQVPSNDGGISLGQLVIASKILK